MNKIRIASLEDFVELYQIGKSTPELKVSATEDFMSEEEFKLAIQNPKGLFLISKNNERVNGFLYATTNDMEKSLEQKWACIVYIAVLPEFQKLGYGKSLYNECEKQLKKRGITNIYCWANGEDDGKVVEFMKKQGLKKGHQCIWMDKKL